MPKRKKLKIIRKATKPWRKTQTKMKKQIEKSEILHEYPPDFLKTRILETNRRSYIPDLETRKRAFEPTFRSLIHSYHSMGLKEFNRYINKFGDKRIRELWQSLKKEGLWEKVVKDATKYERRT